MGLPWGIELMTHQRMWYVLSCLWDDVYKRTLAANCKVFYLMTHSTHFIYGYMASDICLRTILIVRKETCCCHIGYSWLAARVLLYAPSHRQDSTYHSLCCTSREALAGMRNSSMGPPHEGSIRRPIAPWANALTTELYLALSVKSSVVTTPFMFHPKIVHCVCLQICHICCGLTCQTDSGDVQGAEEDFFLLTL